MEEFLGVALFGFISYLVISFIWSMRWYIMAIVGFVVSFIFLLVWSQAQQEVPELGQIVMLYGAGAGAFAVAKKILANNR